MITGVSDGQLLQLIVNTVRTEIAGASTSTGCRDPILGIADTREWAAAGDRPRLDLSVAGLFTLPDCRRIIEDVNA
jgi:hypothetical protein